MKNFIYVLIFVFSGALYSSELAYSSYRGSLDDVAVKENPEAPLYQVSDTTVFPFRAMGRIATGCTGTLIGPKEILTAAHCVYSMKKDIFYNDLEFSPAQNGNSYPYGTLEWERVRAPTEWTDEHDHNYDFAVITLKEKIGNSLGWIGMKLAGEVEDESVQISGYAGAKKFGTLWKSNCTLLSPTSHWLDYYCETQSGMSGSSVVLLNRLEDNYQVIGVHALGGTLYNSGVRITSEVYKMIQSWK